MRSSEFLLPERLIRVNSFTEFIHELNACMSSGGKKERGEKGKKSSDQAQKNINESGCTICILKPKWS